MGEKDEGGLRSLLGKANKWLSDQGVKKEDLEKAKADRERWDAEEAAAKESEARQDRTSRVGDSHVTLRGKVEGTVDAGLAVQTEREDGTLIVSVEPVDPVPLRGGSFAGLTFSIPNYTGPGTYDLGTVDVGSQTYELMLEPAEEGFYWTAEYGPGVVKVSADEATADIHFVYRDPGSNSIELEGVVRLT